MNSQEILLLLKEKGFHMTIVNLETRIPYMRLNKCIKGDLELKESEYRRLGAYASSKGLRA